jgi:mRNA interferase MazF
MFIAITTNVARAGTYDVPISSTHPQFQTTGLHYDSVVRVGKLFTLSQTLVAKKLGAFDTDFQTDINAQLRAFLEL